MLFLSMTNEIKEVLYFSSKQFHFLFTLRVSPKLNKGLACFKT